MWKENASMLLYMFFKKLYFRYLLADSGNMRVINVYNSQNLYGEDAVTEKWEIPQLVLKYEYVNVL